MLHLKQITADRICFHSLCRFHEVYLRCTADGIHDPGTDALLTESSKSPVGIANIRLTSIKEAVDFVNSASRQPYNVDLSREIYNVDAKSILGVLVLGLGNMMESVI